MALQCRHTYPAQVMRMSLFQQHSDQSKDKFAEGTLRFSTGNQENINQCPMFDVC